jgi:hypothetical protein
MAVGRTTKTVRADILRLPFPNYFLVHGAILWHVIEHIPDLRAAFLANYDVFVDLARCTRSTKLSRPWTVSRSAASDEERIACADPKDHVWSLSCPDFEHNVLIDTAGLVECQNVPPMLLEQLGPSVYDRFPLHNNNMFQLGESLPQYLCRTPVTPPPGM